MSLPPKSAGVYRLRNRFTGAAYIGATNNLRARCSGHFSKLVRGAGAIKIQRSYDQFGKDGFFESRAFKVLKPTLNHERDSIEYEVWRKPGAQWEPRRPARRYCPSCSASITSTDVANRACTQCGAVLK